MKKIFIISVLMMLMSLNCIGDTMTLEGRNSLQGEYWEWLQDHRGYEDNMGVDPYWDEFMEWKDNQPEAEPVKIDTATTSYMEVIDSLCIYRGMISDTLIYNTNSKMFYDLGYTLNTGTYKKYEIYFEIEIDTPGVSYTEPFIKGRYFDTIMLDTLFDRLIRKRVEYEADKLIPNEDFYHDTYTIKVIYIIDRLEERTTVYEE